MGPTYTVQITFNRAKNLPVADIGTLSCDPYVLASLVIPDADPLKFRTPTVRRNRDPTWDATWFVSGVPASGFKLVMILYDEDPGEFKDDRLGKAVARLGPEQMNEGFESLETEYTLQKRKGDLHPYILTYLTACLPGEKLKKHNRVVASLRVLRKDSDQKDDQRMYTLGPNHYSRHFSPLIGSMVNKAPSKDAPSKDANDTDGQTDGKGNALSATTFIANKLQLTGPVPRELRHRFVGYKPFIDWMFADSGIAGRVLHHGLRRQYRTVYACDKSTVWGVVDDTDVNSSNVGAPPAAKDDGALRDATPESSAALARQFLDMTAWGEGAKLFTYVIILDGEWRFTETGPEFAIDLLSKHSMHADLAVEIAYSGEFFVQPVKGAKKETQGESAPEKENGEQKRAPEPSRNPKDYELIIDNDSGTYRPKKELLPVLQDWLADARRLGGLGGVRAMDGFDEALKGMKEARAREKAELTGVGKKEKGADGGRGRGKLVPIRRGTSVSSISSGAIGRNSVSSREVEGALKQLDEPEGEKKGVAGRLFADGRSNAVDGHLPVLYFTTSHYCFTYVYYHGLVDSSSDRTGGHQILATASIKVPLGSPGSI
ncbi:hypothetical protein DFH09DRAFT_1056521 [Mycena vulgaris]|nr:hypothetical protein DFH09DRAFT_1056521 [Mycena vulgaris]